MDVTNRQWRYKGGRRPQRASRQGGRGVRWRAPDMETIACDRRLLDSSASHAFRPMPATRTDLAANAKPRLERAPATSSSLPLSSCSKVNRAESSLFLKSASSASFCLITAFSMSRIEVVQRSLSLSNSLPWSGWERLTRLNLPYQR